MGDIVLDDTTSIARHSCCMTAEPSGSLEAAARARISAERLTAPMPLRSIGHLALAWGAQVALAWLTVTTDLLAFKIVAWWLMAWLLLGNAAIMHETLHGHLFRSRLANRIVGTVAGLTLMLPWALYKVFHLGHHQHTVNDDDPEGIPPAIPSRLAYPLVLIGGPVWLVMLLWDGVSAAAGRRPWWVRHEGQRREIVGAMALLLVSLFVVAAALVRAPGVVIDAWLAPWLLLLTVIFPLVLMPEHYGGTPGGSVFETTRTVTSGPLVRWLVWNNNFHTAHHLAPGVVHQNLPRAHQLIERDMVPFWLRRSYLNTHAMFVRQLPWRAPANPAVSAADPEVR
jgi:fatty acid desaturase